MRTENEFNRKLGSLLKMQKDLFYRKLSDKYQVGMSDFILIKKGKTVFIECKYKKDLKGPLKHPFSGPQLSFMKQASSGGAECYGLVWIDSLSSFYLLPESTLLGIIPSGEDLVSKSCMRFNLTPSEIKTMIAYLWGK
jgi:hypothetical protein